MRATRKRMLVLIAAFCVLAVLMTLAYIRKGIQHPLYMRKKLCKKARLIP